MWGKERETLVCGEMCLTAGLSSAFHSRGTAHNTDTCARRLSLHCRLIQSHACVNACLTAADSEQTPGKRNVVALQALPTLTAAAMLVLSAHLAGFNMQTCMSSNLTGSTCDCLVSCTPEQSFQGMFHNQCLSCVRHTNHPCDLTLSVIIGPFYVC